MEEKLAPVAAFIEAACVPLDSGHSSGTLERAQSILAEHPEVAAPRRSTGERVRSQSGYAEVDDLLRSYQS